MIVRRITVADAPGNWIGYSDNVAYDLILSDVTYGAGDQLQFTVKLKNQGTIDIQDAPGFGRIADLVWRSVETGVERLLGSSRVDDNYVRSQEFLTFGRWFLDGTELTPGYYDVFARVRADAAEPVDLRANNESNAVRVFFGSEDQRRLVEMSDLSVEALTITRGGTGALSATATIANKGGPRRPGRDHRRALCRTYRRHRFPDREVRGTRCPRRRYRRGASDNDARLLEC